MTDAEFRQSVYGEYEIYRNGMYRGRIVEKQSWKEAAICWHDAAIYDQNKVNDYHLTQTKKLRRKARKAGGNVALTRIKLKRVLATKPTLIYQIKLDSSMLRFRENDLVTRNAVATLPEAMRLAAMLYT